MEAATVMIRIFYHRDTEAQSFGNFKFFSDPELRVLCVSVVNIFFSVPSIPLCDLPSLTGA